jgi:uncharacterized cupredoxin-like copper-binding protein
MRIVRHGLVVAAVFLLASLAWACGGSPSSDAIEVSLTDGAITFSGSSEAIAAGDVAFSGTNDGSTVHELELFSVPDGVDATSLDVSDNVADTDAAGMDVIDEVEDIAPSTTVELSADLEPGTYAFICNLPGHYAQGMVAEFTVS